MPAQASPASERRTAPRWHNVAFRFTQIYSVTSLRTGGNSKMHLASDETPCSYWPGICQKKNCHLLWIVQVCRCGVKGLFKVGAACQTHFIDVNPRVHRWTASALNHFTTLLDLCNKNSTYIYYGYGIFSICTLSTELSAMLLSHLPLVRVQNYKQTCTFLEVLTTMRIPLLELVAQNFAGSHTNTCMYVSASAVCLWVFVAAKDGWIWRLGAE